MLAAVHFAFYDQAHRAPVLLRPALLVYDGFVLFLAVNLFAFVVNLFKSLSSVRGCKDEQRIQQVMEPAFHGHIADKRLLYWTDIPFFVSLGVLIVGILICVFR